MTCNNFEGPAVATVDSAAVASTTATGNRAAHTEVLLAEVLAGVLRTEQVPVDGHFFTDLGADSLVMAQFCARVRKRDDLPTVSMKDIYQHSTVQSLAAALTDTAPAPVGPPSATAAEQRNGTPTDMQTLLAEVLAGVLRTEQVPVDDHFFTDLGADSLVMAQFCARVRKRDDLPTVSMKDIYRNPTIRTLAAELDMPQAEPARSDAPAQTGIPAQPSSEGTTSTRAAEAPATARTWQYVMCGALQLLMFLGMSFLGALVAMSGYEWIRAGTGAADFYLRSALFAGMSFVGLCALPVVAKWTLIGRFRPRRIPVWSLSYVRFWCVKTLIRTSPMRLFTGSPLYVLYLRALGAKIGRGVAIFSRNVPVCTDLLTIEEGTVVRKDVLFSCYRAHAGVIERGTVTLGRNVTVSEQTVLDIDTSMGDGAQLGHASALHPGQRVPAGESWHGSPAQPGKTDFRAVEPTPCGTLRKALYTAAQLLVVLGVYLPLTLAGASMLFTALPQLNGLLNPEPAFTSPGFYGDALIASSVAFFGGLLLGLVTVNAVPRMLSLAIKPGRVYPLYGFHHGLQRALTRMTNVRFFTTLFGDSSAIVHYLRCLGYDLCRVEQTGSNFGSLLKHDTPYLSRVGSGTVVADGLSIINADFSSSSFRLSPTSIGPSNFLGNNIAYPSRGRTGDNCLLATKVMVPIDGPVREGVGLLGSPSFEIPRTVMRDQQFDHLAEGDELRRRLASKNKHNALTASLYLLVRWFHFVVVALIAMTAVDLYHALGVPAIALASLLTLMFTVVYFTLVERAVTLFRPLKPLYCSIYESSFWRHERFWKLTAHQYMQFFNGTPFKSVVWRLLGVRIGRRVFDDGCSLVERTLVAIGDGCTLNAGTIIQCHSQEDGAFKSDHATIGAGVTLGVGAFVHYGTTVGDDAQLAADSFLMKGEEVPPHAGWGGNPAREGVGVNERS
ncbi:peptide synthetase [Streptomyces sp. PSKA54]|uniref:Peptide synthetase n=1 Tax=Streptomyces himalayensis subsp. aureolus TaxID=2758039 RepID=A0A7W2D3W5_9ACTN|nr:Pls/PosA family non-ribosomal peptide synthetase [Streptomyces himalayensis]MBA4864303.1 peptide synthetase [Streptomyces himalayensis subsp. aureolus]